MKLLSLVAALLMVGGCTSAQTKIVGPQGTQESKCLDSSCVGGGVVGPVVGIGVPTYPYYYYPYGGGAGYRLWRGGW